MKLKKDEWLVQLIRGEDSTEIQEVLCQNFQFNCYSTLPLKLLEMKFSFSEWNFKLK